jgi:PAS domain S-box-containing protein
VTGRAYVDDHAVAVPTATADAMLARSTGLSCTFDDVGRIRYVSPGAAAVIGVPPAQLVGDTLDDAGEPARAALDRLRQQVQRTGDVLRGTFGEGATRHPFVLGPVRSAGRDDGPVNGVVCTFEDEPVTGTEAISVDPRSPVFAHSPIAVGVTSRSGAWTEVNPALCALTGYDRATLLTLSVHDVTAPEDRHDDFVYLRQLQAGELTGYQLQKRWRDAGGEDLWVLLTVSAVPGPGGRCADHLVVQAQDITAHKEAESRARLLTDLVESSGDAIWARDGDGEVVYWNRAAAGLLGYEAADVIGGGAVVPESRVAETAQALAIAAGGRSVGPLDTVRRHKDGHDVDVSVTVSPIHDPDGGLLGFVSVARDITARRRDEEQLRVAHAELQRRTVALEQVNAELQRSNDDLHQFAYAASHDLSEPLRAITGFTQLLAQDYRGRLDEEADVFIEFIVDGTVRMRQLLDGLLLYSRLNMRPATPVPVALAEVVDEVLSGLDLRIAEAGATVDVGPLPVVEGERAQLVQMVQHLLANAMIYRSPSRPPVIRILGEEHDDRLVVHVDDNGIGIEPQHRERIFRMFARLHGRDDYAGTGIGLAMVQRIVDRHRGTVEVSDSPLGGARFTITLPR